MLIKGLAIPRPDFPKVIDTQQVLFQALLEKVIFIKTLQINIVVYFKRLFEKKSVIKSLITFFKSCYTVTQNVGKVHRLLNRFISIKTFETYVHIIKLADSYSTCRELSFEVSPYLSMVVFYHCSCVAPSLVKIETPANTPRSLETFDRGRGVQKGRGLAGAGDPVGLWI